MPHPNASRRGKIARLPETVREQLNCRLCDNEPAASLLPWLNALPEARQTLVAYFRGARITVQNLSHWRQNGFQQWLTQREIAAQMRVVLALKATQNQPAATSSGS